MAFFLCEVELCQKDIAVNHLKILVLKKNQNWALKKKEKLKKISKKRQINHEFWKLFKPVMGFFEFYYPFKYV